MKAFGILVGAVVLVLFFYSSVFADKITAKEGREKVSKGALLVDVRSPDEFNAGHVDGAINIPHDTISDRLRELGDNKEREIVLYCRSGRRSGLAMDELRSKGFAHVYNAGGLSDWVKASAQCENC